MVLHLIKDKFYMIQRNDAVVFILSFLWWSQQSFLLHLSVANFRCFFYYFILRAVISYTVSIVFLLLLLCRPEKSTLESSSSLPDDPSKLSIPGKKVAPSHSADTLTSQSSNPSSPTTVLSTTASTSTLVGSLGSSDSPKPSPSK